ncbi:hypothetical protein FSARC_7132 [Fusarium sarcochroum]|uniref:Uncharacterized protein n=1 Tax=Fusarium sarcochroum TaxID=1208366 RepID=A0A8H4X7P4_9HYPO|nr:hypothetical protein FSARC_7132 [Fusarium sarcochroum]
MLILYILISCFTPALATAIELNASDFKIQIDDITGALVGIRDPKASASMNWVSAPSNTPWQPTASRWRTHLYPRPANEKPSRPHTVPIPYKFSSPVVSMNERGCSPNAFGIYTPFNDHYTNMTDALEARAHAHIWANGGSTAWVKMNQMGGNGSDLGLVVTEGALAGYSV